MRIHKKISKYNNSERGEFKYIVIHYIGAVSSAKNNAIYFAGGDRQASAHYYVDHEIWQGTKLSRASWHCGGAKTIYFNEPEDISEEIIEETEE